MAAEGITVVCKTLKEGTFELSSVETSITVGELKGLMTEARDNITDPKSLKLVFKGKILKDNDSLEKAGFTTKNNKVVVMKVKAKKKKAKPVEASTVPAATSVTAPSAAPANNNNSNNNAAIPAAAATAATENTVPTMATENNSSSASAPNTDYTAQVAQLVALGVPENQALNALRMTQGNVEMAANLALGGGMGMAAAAQAQAQGNAPQGMPGMGMGPMPSPAQIAQIAQNPQLLEQLRNHPQIANNPQMQAIMNNPQMLQALLARFAQGGMGGMPGGMGGMQGMPGGMQGMPQQAAPAPVQIQLSEAEQAHVEQIVAIAAVPRERAVRAYMAGGKNVEHAINLLFSGAFDD